MDRTVSDLTSLGARYRELSAELAKLRAEIHIHALENPDVTDDAYAEALGWKVETVKKWRYSAAPKPEKPKRVPKRAVLLSLLTDQWQEAGTILPFLAAQVGWKPASVKTVLHEMEAEGLIETKSRPGKFNGKKVRVRTHYRRTPSATDVSLSI